MCKRYKNIIVRFFPKNLILLIIWKNKDYRSSIFKIKALAYLHLTPSVSSAFFKSSPQSSPSKSPSMSQVLQSEPPQDENRTTKEATAKNDFSNFIGIDF